MVGYVRVTLPIWPRTQMRALAISTFFALAIPSSALATHEGLGLVYQPLACPQTSEPEVSPVSIMNYEPGGLQHALPMICHSNVLADSYWMGQKRPLSEPASVRIWGC